MQTDLAQLARRTAHVEAPPVDEAALRAQFRDAAQRARSAAAASGPAGARGAFTLPRPPSWFSLVGAVLAAVLLRVEQPAPVPVAAQPPQAEAARDQRVSAAA